MRDYDKVIVEIDDDNEDEYDFDYICNVIRSCFIDEGMRDVSEGNRLVFVTMKGDAHGYSAVGLSINAIYDSWLRPYIKKMKWYEDDGSVEDVLESFSRFDERN